RPDGRRPRAGAEPGGAGGARGRRRVARRGARLLSHAPARRACSAPRPRIGCRARRRARTRHRPPRRLRRARPAGTRRGPGAHRDRRCRRRRAAADAPSRSAGPARARGARPARPARGSSGAGGMTAAPVPSSRPPTSSAHPSGGDAALKQRVHRRLVAAGGLDPLDHFDEHDRAGRSLAVRTRLAELLHDEAPLLTPARFEDLLSDLTDEVSGLGPLEPLLADPDVSEVMLNGPGRAYVERAGRLEAAELDLDAGGIVRLVERVVAPLGLRLDRASPLGDARPADGSRLHALLPPLALDRPPNAEGAGAVSVRDLVRTALRMRPDRIVVGEVRGGEALDMLQALNTGHDGSLSTVHANGPADVLPRLETLVLMAGAGLPLV